MKGFFKYSLFALVFTLLVTPLFAKTHTVRIQQAVTVGSTQIPAGDYKLSWEGTGPMVKVTLAQRGATPVVLDAKLVTGNKNVITDASIVTAAQNGTIVLQEIQLKSTSLLFEGGELAAK